MVPDATLVVATDVVSVAPSLIVDDDGVTTYVGFNDIGSSVIVRRMGFMGQLEKYGVQAGVAATSIHSSASFFVSPTIHKSTANVS